MDQLLRDLLETIVDSSHKCSDAISSDNDSDRLHCVDDVVLLLSTALNDARFIRDTILESLE